ncbi:MAG: hypothetical protein UT30_C0014G0012 [Candidatus Uhrbacteria bacterium GW2011_GWF2_39_13]|uniref:Uncharacterized protein n=1 Tax=Candidatus Uhrbacteria bacterium GW2011_GWF2_39_13 TaxID=1618995 RepID=A0A0G0MIX3_9BACT|nr:MAG: hypothetical protein UT30_C0014G0012 [Candidatus Uhrbacteria bacterium GW2011_GWF2_39_13]
MKEFEIRTIKDIYLIKYVYEQFDQIVVYTKTLKNQGVLRHAFKYAFWALKDNGHIIVKDQQSCRFGVGRKNSDFWVVRSEFFKTLYNVVCVLEVSDDKRFIRVQKQSSHHFDSISFGLLFSGSDSEKELLKSVVESIAKNTAIRHIKHEVIICGPDSFDPAQIINQHPDINIRYLVFNHAYEAGRFVVCKKKNYLYKHCQYEIISISHLRIMYPDDFVEKIISRQFDIITPRVVVNSPSGKQFSYLDYMLLETYDVTASGINRRFDRIWFGDNYFGFLRSRVAFIDGGLNVFNHLAIKEPPYDDRLSWAEAEDVDMCYGLHQRGFLIDYFDDIKCESATCKTNLAGWRFLIKRLISPLYK